PMEFEAEGGTGGGLASDRYYDHARTHVGALGRFLSADSSSTRPELVATWNRYLYAADNPIRFLDPDGRAYSTPPRVVEQLRKNADIRDQAAAPPERSANGLSRAVAARAPGSGVPTCGRGPL